MRLQASTRGGLVGIAVRRPPAENGRALDVHHIKPYRYTKDNSPENLVALCRSCHMRSVDRGRRGAARFAGPQQLELKPPTQRELRQRRGLKRQLKRLALQAQAYLLNASGRSLREIAGELGVSRQTIANWLSARESYPEGYQEAR